MKYATMTDAEKERVFAEDVLGWVLDEYGDYRTPDGQGFVSYSHPKNDSIQDFPLFRPLKKENIFQAMMGVEKLISEKRVITQLWHDHSEKWHCILTIPPDHYHSASDTLNAAIVEACIKIARPDLFTED